MLESRKRQENDKKTTKTWQEHDKKWQENDKKWLNKWQKMTNMTKMTKNDTTKQEWQKNAKNKWQKMTKINNQQPSEFAGKIFISLNAFRKSERQSKKKWDWWNTGMGAEAFNTETVVSIHGADMYHCVSKCDALLASHPYAAMQCATTATEPEVRGNDVNAATPARTTSGNTVWKYVTAAHLELAWV
jgi:hypothetical protein